MIRVGVVGVGKMGLLHSAMVRRLPDADLVGVMDNNIGLKPLLRSMGLSVPFYTSLDSLIEGSRPDALFVCTPHSTHLPIARQGLSRGMHLFIEKPLADSIEASRELLEIGRSVDPVCMVGYTFAYLPIVRRAKEILESGEIGSVRHVEASMVISQVLSAKKGWRYDPSQSGGGVLMNVASHLAYLLYDFFGPARSVTATLRRIHSTKVEDEVEALIDFEGVQARLNSSWSVPGHPASHFQVKIEGALGSLHLTNERVRWTASRAGGEQVEYAAGLGAGVGFDLGGDGFYGEGYYLEDQDFLASIAGRRRPRVGLEAGFHVQEILDAIYRSGSRNAPVSLEAIPS